MSQTSKGHRSRRDFLLGVAGAGACAGLLPAFGIRPPAAESSVAFSAKSPRDLDGLKAGWLDPARTYRPHTRWWWPGASVTRDGIAWELEQMRRQGMGGVEIMMPWRMYAKGNIPYLSPQFVEMVQYAILEAERLDMEVAISFCAGWKFGGFFVPPTQRSKVLTHASVDVSGPGTFNQALPEYEPAPGTVLFHSDAPDENQIMAVVASKVSGDRLDADSLMNLTSQVEDNHLQWQIPAGQWRVMAFRLKYTGEVSATTANFPRHQWVVDHFSKEAVRNYCEYLGGTYYQAFGEQFGKTLDTFFCDSFEIAVLPDTIHWSNAALEEFKAYKGYDLARYLPAIWWDIGELTPKVRYDVNDFLGWLGLDATFLSFINWCGKHNAQARIQPYFRFTEEVIQGAGMTPRPEMEATTDRFAVLLNPRKQVAAGGHLYGHRIISAEAYTFLHDERYRTTLEQLKGATDAFLRDGVTQFYNHGYIYSPEMHVAPSRDVPWANRISHWNTWWKYYHYLTAYISRCCFLLRQGEFVGDVLIYSPQATVWTERVLFGNRQRIMPFGNLGKTLVANGYDFDPVNDDVLQNRARVEDGRIKVRDLAYRFLILPNTAAVPVATMEFIRQFVLGGGIVIALDQLPSASVGLEDYAQDDAQVKQIVSELFGPSGQGKTHPGGGRTYYLSDYKIPNYEMTLKAFNIGPQPYQPTPPLTPPQQELLEALRSHLPPDFALAGNAQSNGLTFLHRRLGLVDIYFVTNLQPQASQTAVTFRVTGKTPERWDPMTGEITPVFVYRSHETGVEVPLNLPPWASTCLMFKSGPAHRYVSETNLDSVLEVTPRQVEGIVSHNGKARVTLVENGASRSAETSVSDLPQPYEISGSWQMALEGYQHPKLEKTVSKLESWTEDPQSEHFSGTGRYELDFQLPGEYVRDGIELVLDLGAVGDVAEVAVNGEAAGVAWMQPYQLNVTEALRAGGNHLTILVTNTLINYVSGLSKLPDVPEDLVPHYGATVDVYSAGTAEWERREKGFHPLPPSGLMGPVRIIPRRKVTLSLGVIQHVEKPTH